MSALRSEGARSGSPCSVLDSPGICPAPAVLTSASLSFSSATNAATKSSLTTSSPTALASLTKWSATMYLTRQLLSQTACRMEPRRYVFVSACGRISAMAIKSETVRRRTESWSSVLSLRYRGIMSAITDEGESSFAKAWRARGGVDSKQP